MLCKNQSPSPASPAGTEISVGSPSPPPTLINLSKDTAIQSTSLLTSNDRKQFTAVAEPYIPTKRLKPLMEIEPVIRNYHRSRSRSRSISPPSSSPEPPPPPQSQRQIVPQLLPPPAVPLQESSCEKLNVDKVKSFSIADILGHRETKLRNEVAAAQQLQNHLEQQQRQLMERNQNDNMNLLATKIVRPWDHLRGPIPVRPFLPSALFHYEQRLALDYQRQLHEHLNAQAELLRQRMSLDINHSETGSERSSSAASDCCSPTDIANRLSVDSIHNLSNHQHHHRHSPRGNNNLNGTSSTTTITSKQQNNSTNNQKTKPNDTPLDALFQLTNKNFDEDEDQTHIDFFSTKQQPKKKRKSRTAFTNHQIFELEKRFLYQKYLSPADRDEIAAGLGLSNAQVITWFQNRRAKLKRDMEELKKDVESVKALSAHKSFLENVNDLSILKKKPIHDHITDDDHHIHGRHITIAHHHHHHSPQPTQTLCSPQK